MAEVKTDCFAYKEKIKKCVALNDLYCKREECKFYKSKHGNKEVKTDE